MIERIEVPIVVMGVAGCGKSTVGALLANALRVEYAEGDALHPAANIEKMSAGIPLTDADRAPWLDIIAGWLGEHQQGGVVSCSALKHSYRDRLRAGASGVYFVHLAADRDQMARRMAARPGHFMPVSLLDSQFAALEPLSEDEYGGTFDATAAPEDLIDQVIAALRN